MFGRKPILPVAPEEAAWIDSSFLLLIDLFGIEWVMNAPLVLPTEKFFPKKYEATEDWAGCAFDCVCTLMQVNRQRVELVFEQDAMDHLRKTGLNIGRTSGAAGLYSSAKTGEGPLRERICVKETLIKDPESMIAIMAHELAHVLLLGDGKIDRAMDRMEPLTDLMTVFSGFGVFNANAAHIHKSSHHGWSVARYGYLTPREYAYALAVFAWTREERPPKWEKELATNVKVFMKDSLAFFKASGRV